MGIRSAARAFLYGPPAIPDPPRAGPHWEFGAKADGGRAAVATLGGALGFNSVQGQSRMRDFRSYLNAITIPNVYKATSVIAYNYAKSAFRILDAADAEVDVRARHPELQKLLDAPNSLMDGFTLKELISYDLSLCGNCFVALDSFTLLGLPTEMYRLRPDLVRIAQLDGGLMFGLEARTPADMTWYDAAEILHFKRANPRDPVWGMGDIEAAEVAFASDRGLNEFRRAYFDRGAILEGILSTDQELNKAQSEEIRSRWEAQKNAAGSRFRTAVLGMGSKYQPIQEPLGNIDIVGLSKMSRNEILEIFGVPPQKLGDFEGTNYRNSQAADLFFDGDTMAPLEERTQGTWTQLAALWDPGYHAAYPERDLTDYQTRAQTANWLAQAGGAFTRNDIRVAAGFDPCDEGDPDGYVYLSTAKNEVILPADMREDLLDLPAVPGGSADTDPAPPRLAPAPPPSPQIAAAPAPGQIGAARQAPPGAGHGRPPPVLVTQAKARGMSLGAGCSGDRAPRPPLSLHPARYRAEQRRAAALVAGTTELRALPAHEED